MTPLKASSNNIYLPPPPSATHPAPPQNDLGRFNLWSCCERFQKLLSPPQDTEFDLTLDRSISYRSDDSILSPAAQVIQREPVASPLDKTFSFNDDRKVIPLNFDTDIIFNMGTIDLFHSACPLDITIKMGASTYSVKDMGTYETGRVIGTGRFGKVLVGTDELGREVAIKACINPDPECEELTLRFNQEASTQLSLDGISDFVLGAKNAGKCRNMVFIVTDWLKGGDLYDYTDNHPFGSSNIAALRLMLDTAMGLDVLHRYGIIHRDLKLENIMVHEKRAKIIDFETAYFLPDGDDSIDLRDRVGTIGYIAPEVEKDGRFSRASDVFAFGVTMYHFFIQDNIPHKQHSLSPDLDKIKWRSHQKGHYFPVLKLIHKCLSKDPKDRPTIHQVAFRLSKIIDHLESPPKKV